LVIEKMCIAAANYSLQRSVRCASRRTVGLIRPGEFHFTTDAPEQMDIIAGQCRVKFSGESGWKTYKAGEKFNVAGKSTFDIAVDSGLTEYLCTFG